MCFGYCSKETIKQIINFIYEISLDEISNLDFADNVYTPAQVNQFLFNNIDNKQKGIESLLKCNYINLTPTITPREKVHPSTFVEGIDYPEINEDDKVDEKKGDESPRGTTSLDDTFFEEEREKIEANMGVDFSKEYEQKIENIVKISRSKTIPSEFERQLDADIYESTICKYEGSSVRDITL